MATEEKKTPTPSEAVIRFNSLEEAAQFIEALKNEYSTLVGKLVRLLEDVRVARSSIDQLLRLVRELGGEVKQPTIREGPRVKIASAELVILPGPDTLEQILEEVAEAANKKMTALTEISKRIREIAQRNPLTGQVVVEIALLDGIPRYIIIREQSSI